MNIQERAIAQAIEEQAALIEKLQRKQAAFETMREALRLKRNICINNRDGSTIRGTGLVGNWVVIPLVDFEKIQAALALADAAD